MVLESLIIIFHIWFIDTFPLDKHVTTTSPTTQPLVTKIIENLNDKKVIKFLKKEGNNLIK